MRELIAIDHDTLDKLKQMGRNRMAALQELADEAFTDLLVAQERNARGGACEDAGWVGPAAERRFMTTAPDRTRPARRAEAHSRSGQSVPGRQR